MNSRQRMRGLAIWAIVGIVTSPCFAQPAAWVKSFAEARNLAERQNRQLLVCLYDAQHRDSLDRLCNALTNDERLSRRLAEDWVLARIPVSERILVDDEERPLLEQESWSEMMGRPGVAIVDYREPTAAHYGQVVSVMPLGREGAKYRTARPPDDSQPPDWPIPRSEIEVLLDLPAGSLTQRTLIFAIRVHPDGPESTNGALDQQVLQETTSHARYQADRRVQGHQNWDRRFHRINERLPRGLLASEVCAESWRGEGLVEAARSCVHSWRQSSGHWDAVKQRHPVYGYDMKRGSNGVWYATGIFGRTRSSG